MDWLHGMNRVIAYIEENLTQPIQYSSLARIVGCSVYEFSRIFSFMAGISVSEYIRRRRLSQVGPSYYTEPFYQVSAYFCTPGSDKVKTIIGAEYKEAKPEGITLSVETIPAATWAVFSFYGQTGYDKYDEAYTRILTEWLPASQYRRDETAPNLDVYPSGEINENYTWEIWVPVLRK